jgi:uncharacterized protein YoxC
MSEYWEIITAMTLFAVFLSVQLDRSFRETNQKLESIKSTLNRLEDKIDGHDRSSYRG